MKSKDLLLEDFQDLFFLNIHHYIEGRRRNVGLDKKVCIDQPGNIKNFVSHESAFEKFQFDKISKIDAMDFYQKKWCIINLQIEKCKGCINRIPCYCRSEFEGNVVNCSKQMNAIIINS